MDSEGDDVIRVTSSSYHHFLVGSDKTGGHLVVTRAVEDTSSPTGFGDEDRKSLWIIDLETGEETRLTGESDTAEGDSYAPDSKWIVFWMIPEGEVSSDIYKIHRDGSQLIQLTDTPEVNEFDQQWSNGGEDIAYVSYSASRLRFVLNLMKPDGSEMRTIYDPEDSVVTPYFPPGVFDPSWSPNDEWIVFEKPVQYGEENGDAGIWYIFKITVEGTGLTDLSEAGEHDVWGEYLPSFSSDGVFIVFTARYGGTDPSEVGIDVFVMDNNRGSLRKLSDNWAYNDAAVWVGSKT